MATIKWPHQLRGRPWKAVDSGCWSLRLPWEGFLPSIGARDTCGLSSRSPGRMGVLSQRKWHCLERAPSPASIFINGGRYFGRTPSKALSVGLHSCMKSWVTRHSVLINQVPSVCCYGHGISQWWVIIGPFNKLLSLVGSGRYAVSTITTAALYTYYDSNSSAYLQGQYHFEMRSNYNYHIKARLAPQM